MEPWSAGRSVGRSVGCLILDGTREKGKKNLQGLCEKTEMIIMIFFLPTYNMSVGFKWVQQVCRRGVLNTLQY